MLVEFPADDPERALRFWSELLERPLQARIEAAGEGWQSADGAIGLHARGRGPGDTGALAYLPVDDLQAALVRVRELGGTVIHPGERWAVCRDSEGSPFGLQERRAT